MNETQTDHIPTVPHYHTTCNRCDQTIIMAKSIYPPFNWGPRELTGKGHDCPNRPQRQQGGPIAGGQL